MYIKSEIEYKLRNDLIPSDQQSFESLFVEICRPKEKNIIVGTIYRPPNLNPNEFIKDLNDLLTKISREKNKLCYLLGDYNLNLIGHYCHQQTSDFLDLMYSCMFYPLITRPTRITAHTATLIDNIFTNNLDEQAFNGLLFTDISDHIPIFSITSIQHSDSASSVSTVFRDKSKANMSKFKDNLGNFDWTSLNGYNDPSRAYDTFLEKFMNTYNSSFPLKRAKDRKHFYKKPWLSKGLSKSIKRKNRLYKHFLSKPSLDNEQKYKAYKNKLTQSLRMAKRVYYEGKLEAAKSNIKHTWKILNEILNRSTKAHKVCSSFKIDNRDVSDPTEIANRFCDYFTNIGPNLAKNISPSLNAHRSYLKGNFANSIFLDLTNEQEVIDWSMIFEWGLLQAMTTFPSR